MGRPYAGRDRPGRGGDRLHRLYAPLRARPPRPARQGSAARLVRPRTGEVERRDRPDVLDFLCHDVGAIGQRRAALFRFLLRLRRGDAALGGDLGDPRLCRPACPDPVQKRRRFATAAHLSSRPAACAAAAARCHRTAGPAGRAVGALVAIRKFRRAARGPIPSAAAAPGHAPRPNARAGPGAAPQGRPRAVAKPDPAGQCVRGRDRRRTHRRLAPRRYRPADGGQRADSPHQSRRRPDPRRRHVRSRLARRQAVLAVDRRRWKFRRQGRSQNRDPRGSRRHLCVFPLHLGGFDALAEAAAAGQGSRWMAPASFRFSARRRTSIQRRQVFGAADHHGCHAGRRPNLSSRAAAGRRCAGHHERTRTALHGSRLRRCLAVESHQRRPDRMDGRCPFRATARSDPDAGGQRRSVQRRLCARPGNGKLPRQFHRRGRHLRRSAPQPPGRPAAPAQRRRRHDRRAGRYRPRSHSWRKRRRALVHDRSGFSSLFDRCRCPHPDGDRDPGRHPGRRIFRRSRRRSMCSPLGLRPLGARGETPAGHNK